jgi:uncharacterized protein (DUF433 family)
MRGLPPQQSSGTVNLMGERIVIDSAICHGQPVIRGTRVPAGIVVGSLAGGMTFEEIEREYDVCREDIRAALRFVNALAEEESVHPLTVSTP